MRILAIALVVFAVAVSGCGGSDGGADPATGSGTTATTSQVPFDRAFIDAMVSHHQSAIEMAREAKAAGLAEPELIQIADDIIASQQSEIDDMLSWRKQWFGSGKRDSEEAALKVLGLTPGQAGMEHGSTSMSDADDVDQAFAESMIGHHEGAIRMASLAESNADHAEIKTLAGDIVTAQKREIEVMEEHAMAMH